MDCRGEAADPLGGWRWWLRAGMGGIEAFLLVLSLFPGVSWDGLFGIVDFWS